MSETIVLSKPLKPAHPDSNAGAVSASARIAEFAYRFGASHLTEKHLRECARALIDTYAVAVAGKNEDAARLALRYVMEVHAGGQAEGAGRQPAGKARLWGLSCLASMEGAALWNGIAAHVLDFDDVSYPMRGHPSVGLLPALVAIADARDLPGRLVASAYVVGFEVICRLSRAMAREHYEKGWHSTSSIGTIGAAVACAHLLSLDPRRIAFAIGLAVSQTAGTRENFGTDAKSFQAGHCAMAGVRSALLAELGFSASGDALDGALGYMNLYARNEKLEPELVTLGQAPFELERCGIEIKKYPMCYATHLAVDAVLGLRKQHDLRLDAVAGALVETSCGALLPLIYARPRTGLQGKFSIEYAVAAALADGAIRLSSFTDAAVLRPEIQSFLASTVTREAPGPSSPRWAQVTITLKDGRTLQRRVDRLHGSAEQPLSDQELIEKAADCLAWRHARTDANLLSRAAFGLGTLRMREILDMVQP